MQFYENLCSQIAYLERRRRQLEAKMRRMPKGRMEKKCAKGKFYFYEYCNGRRKSLLRNQERKELYLERDETQRQLEIVKNNLSLLERIRSKYEPVRYQAINLNDCESGQNTYKTEEKRHVLNGVAYRSKSEVTIADRLTSFGIKFKYEAAYELNGRTVYPDFIIERPKDGKLIIWEHAGLTNNNAYMHSCFSKVEEYYENGVVLWDNFILSFDNQEGGINVDYIDKLIKMFLL